MSFYDNFPLKISAKPPAFHGSTVRQSITQSLWKKVRQEVLGEHNNTCSICGFHTEESRKLHVHEIENYDFENGICELIDLNLICVKCHAFQHMGRTERVSTKEQMEDLILHFIEVNECDRIDYVNHKLEALNEFSKLSKISPGFDKITFKITCDIPYKEEVINQLKKKELYFD